MNEIRNTGRTHQPERVGNFEYFDAVTKVMAIGFCDPAHEVIFNGRNLFMTPPAGRAKTRTILVRGLGSMTAKSLVMSALGENVWEGEDNPRSRHIFHKNGNPADIRSENLTFDRREAGEISG